MKYLFYPGCSAEGAALEYKRTSEAVLAALGVELQELEDWTCCGSSIAPVRSDLLSVVLPARNLAIAEQTDRHADFLVICSACFTSFRAANTRIATTPGLLDTVNEALAVEGLHYSGGVRVRHLLDVLANDIGPEKIREKVVRPLEGLTVAPYYGCQTVRPYGDYDDNEYPSSMVGILEALGAQVYHHTYEARCCGTSLLTTKPEVGLTMAGRILAAASPADCIAAVCPMCQMNLDAYQDKASRVIGKELHIPVFFLTQLMGLAMGMSRRQVMTRRNIAAPEPALAKVGR
jgi:heterodisulfide reductase subunit B